MDPLTLFALANGAVAAVKKGCQLYKDIKGAAGDVRAVLKDLDEQFHGAYEAKGRTPSPEAKKQFVEEKNRVVQLNKRDSEITGIYTEIGQYLGQYYDNLYKCIAIFEEEERRSKTEIYTGDASIGKRALQRVLMQKQLEQMGTELQELMIYQSPPELGALWTEVNQMMKKLGEEQKIVIAQQMKTQYAQAVKRRKKIDHLWLQAVWGIGAIVVAATLGLTFSFVVEDRIKKYPHLGTDWTPKTEEQRRKEAIPPKYTGR
jgi:hypothetical protein